MTASLTPVTRRYLRDFAFRLGKRAKKKPLVPEKCFSGTKD